MDDKEKKQLNRYGAIIEKLFFNNYKKGATE